VPLRKQTSTLPPDVDALLKKVRLLTAIPPEIRAALIRAGTVRRFRKDAVVWRRGGSATLIYVILSGRIGLFDTMIADRSAVIDLFSPGSVAGGGFTLSDPPYTYLFSGKALDELTVMTIPIPVYRKYLLENPALLIGTARQLLGAWQRLVVQMRDLKQLSADQRLGCYLLAMTDKKSGTATVQLTDDQLLIAGLLGVTRESLSRSFGHLRVQGVTKRGRLIIIEDLRRLRAFCR
jgi:CRP/FNR family transcriptional regulator, transcriptional activator FtrB